MRKSATITHRQSYLQFHVPLNRGAKWYQSLTAAVGGIKDIKLQHGFFHITAAFINNEIGIVEAEKIAGLLNQELKNLIAPTITFDTLDAFITQDGGTYVIYLTSSRVPDEWSALIDRLRLKLITKGYQLGPYKMHVTLARIPVKSIDLESLRSLIKQVNMPVFSLTLSSADYRFYRSTLHAIRVWN